MLPLSVYMLLGRRAPGIFTDTNSYLFDNKKVERINMGMFSLTQELAIDLGTANTLIIYNGKVVVDEPSIVALDVHTGKVVAIGHQARQMHEKTNPNIKTIRPLKDGVIADFNATELMLRGMIKKVKTSGSLFAPSLRMVI